MKQILTLAIILIASTFASKANNIQTANVALNGQNTASDFSLINYDLSWENSWRTSTNESNYDGAWIFAKFRKKNTLVWQHCTINYVSPGTAAACGHTQAGGSTIKTSNDNKGVWQYRTADGMGTVNWLGNKLRWNYGVDGVADNDSVEVRVFAVEMVYIPQGAFNLGSGGNENYHFRDGAVDTYFPIANENALTTGTSAGNLWAMGGSYISSGTIPAAFPKGYNAFWTMKYEFSQQQYADFLNNLGFNDATIRNIGGFTGSHPALVAPNPERAMNGVASTDLMAWLDWAAMRPMTELEYEKSCRGANIIPMPNEFAWGSTTIASLNTPSALGTSSETWAVGNCNYFYSPYSQPMRVGALATATSTRESSGATYYGVMEMSGNEWEWCVTVGNADGLAFTGTHGDGKLTPTTALHNAANWPLATGSGFGIRGGSYGNSASVASLCAISGRDYAVSTNTSRSAGYGGRGVRTAQ